MEYDVVIKKHSYVKRRPSLLAVQFCSDVLFLLF